MPWPRASGVLAHPTSFPGPYGIGDLGPGAVRVLDFLHAARQTLWQVLPLGPTAYGDSPYAATSAFAGNPLLLSPERLVAAGLLDAAALAPAPTIAAPDVVAYAPVTAWKAELLRQAHARFRAGAPPRLRDHYAVFCRQERDWLDDYALFVALKATREGAPWFAWPAALAQREPAALATARDALADEVELHRFTQFLFARQWRAVRVAARRRGLRIIGDLAIFVAHDSADVWAHPELFALDERGAATFVAGVPPDYFSPTGQRWGNPVYRWEALAASGYAWWIARVRRALALADIIRLDHFRGFEAYWEIPAGQPTAEGGRWAPGPGAALFAAIRAALGAVPMIAEDLGVITPKVRALQAQLGLPGMRVLQFAFGGDASSRDLPHNYDRESVVYTGTHDNDTARGWFDALDERTRAHALGYLATTRDEVVWALIRAALGSVAQTAIIPLQDALGLGSAARMNQPARAEGNWGWRCVAEQLTPEVATRLAMLTALYGRG